MKKLLLLTTCLLGTLIAAAPGGPAAPVEAEQAGGRYFPMTHPVTNEIQTHTGIPMIEGSARNISKTLYTSATDLEKPVKDGLLDLLAPYSTDAYVVSRALGNDTDKDCEALFNRLTALAEAIKKTNGAEIASITNAMRILARKSSGLYLGTTTDGKSRK